MIYFKGHEETIKKIYDNNQQHVFDYWEKLNNDEKNSLIKELESINFDLFNKQYKLTKEETKNETDFSPADYIKLPKSKEEFELLQKAKEAGIEHIKAGKVCAFVVAGGQGSRLGYDGPKGAFKVSPVKNKPLFQIHAEKILKYSQKYNVKIPFFIMTSQLNHEATLQHFEENNYYGLDKKDVIMFSQNMIPSMDKEGKLILSDKNKIFKNPDGHGGSLTALFTSGAIETMEKHGIETISYFQIDNPTIKIIDPVFIGFHKMQNCEVSNKTLLKADPLEKVGIFVKLKNGPLGVIEYSDLPDEKAYEKNEDGSIKYAAGSIAIHLFERDFVKKITSGSHLSLPFHIAKKKIKKYTEHGVEQIDGFKFEKFVFDALPLAESATTLETIREEEFAPVKNKEGVDSLETSQELMSNLHKKWLIEKGFNIPKTAETFEISPLLAVEAEDLSDDLDIPNSKEVYLE